MSDQGPFWGGKVHVRAVKCDACLFSKDRIVSGRAAAAHVAAARSAGLGGSFICHKSQVSDEGTTTCRAYYDAYAKDDGLFRLADAMGVLDFSVGAS